MDVSQVTPRCLTESSSDCVEEETVYCHELSAKNFWKKNFPRPSQGGQPMDVDYTVQPWVVSDQPPTFAGGSQDQPRPPTFAEHSVGVAPTFADHSVGVAPTFAEHGVAPTFAGSDLWAGHGMLPGQPPSVGMLPGPRESKLSDQVGEFFFVG